MSQWLCNDYSMLLTVRTWSCHITCATKQWGETSSICLMFPIKDYSQFNTEALALIYGVNKCFKPTCTAEIHFDKYISYSWVSWDQKKEFLLLPQLDCRGGQYSMSSYDIEFWATTAHGNADALSRLAYHKLGLNMCQKLRCVTSNNLRCCQWWARRSGEPHSMTHCSAKSARVHSQRMANRWQSFDNRYNRTLNRGEKTV